MKNIEFKKMKREEIVQVSTLIENLFNEFIGIDYSQAGRATFLEYISANKLEERFLKENHFFLTAQDNGKIIGIIEVRDYNHISLLFVNKKYHNKGIARTLFQKAIDLCLQSISGPEEIEVNSSIYAEKIYQSLGFVKTQEKQQKDGIIYIPMKCKINR